jgi:chromosome segregation ATPase
MSEIVKTDSDTPPLVEPIVEIAKSVGELGAKVEQHTADIAEHTAQITEQAGQWANHETRLSSLESAPMEIATSLREDVNRLADGLASLTEQVEKNSSDLHPENTGNINPPEPKPNPADENREPPKETEAKGPLGGLRRALHRLL